ncbi:MAG: YccF domain-containing protein [Mailhella sp.]|nr:YccF domain-containing protein [Mailhella sp.]
MPSFPQTATSEARVNIIGNILWIVFGGWLTALIWCFFGALACLSIVGLPWGRACFVMAGFAFMPFGYESISREVLYGKKDIGTGVPGTIGNVIWFVFAGLWIALGHIGTAVAQALTIIGIPFAWQNIKMAELALFPIGKTVVPCEIAAEARRRWAAQQYDRMQSRA